MRKYLLGFFVILFMAGVPPVINFYHEELGVVVEKVSVRFGQKRPFSFFYPYNFQFYTPRSRYFENIGACYWVYTNGTYVYKCG